MTWQRNQDKKESDINRKYYMVNGTKKICAVKVSGLTLFELWDNRVFVRRVEAVSFSEAIKLLGES